MTANRRPPGGDQEPREPQGKEAIPWLWLLLGLAATILGCIAAWSLVSGWLFQPPAEAGGPTQATIIVLTAPPSPTAVPTGSVVPPTAIPTFTPIPTPDTAVAPEAITAGFYAVVANTDGLGLTVRGGPSTKNVVITVVDEGQSLLILDGPQEAEEFVWWQVRLDNGLEGWAVENFLEPSALPN